MELVMYDEIIAAALQEKFGDNVVLNDGVISFAIQSNELFCLNINIEIIDGIVLGPCAVSKFYFGYDPYNNFDFSENKGYSDQLFMLQSSLLRGRFEISTLETGAVTAYLKHLESYPSPEPVPYEDDDAFEVQEESYSEAVGCWYCNLFLMLLDEVEPILPFIKEIGLGKKLHPETGRLLTELRKENVVGLYPVQ